MSRFGYFHGPLYLAKNILRNPRYTPYALWISSLILYACSDPLRNTLPDEFTVVALTAMVGVALWFIRSSVIYGFGDSVIFVLTFPFIFVAMLASELMSTNSQEKPDARDLITPTGVTNLSNIIAYTVNRTHACFVDRTEVLADGVYVYLDVPYGIRTPMDAVCTELSREYSFPKNRIIASDEVQRHPYFFIPAEAFVSVTKKRVKRYPWRSTNKFMERLFLRSPHPNDAIG